MNDQPAGVGDNRPPEGDPYALMLEEKNQDLWRKMGALERRRLKLPKQPDTQAEVDVVTDFCADAEMLSREFEARRKEVKDPYLRRGQLIDRTFGEPTKALHLQSLDIAKRNGPFLRAQQEREAAQRREEARIAREKQRLADEAAAAARKAEIEAEMIRAAEENKALEAERQRVRDLEQSAEAEAPTAEANEQAMRDAHRAQQEAVQRTEAREEEARKAGLAADRAERRADQVGDLGKTTAGAANQRANMVWVAKVDSWSKVLQSLGALGPFLNEAVIRDAINRAAKHQNRPDIPGVVYSQELDVKTTIRRS